MSNNSLYDSECAQVDALIDIKKNEIKDLEDLKSSWSEDSWDEPQTQTPAQVAADPNATSEERAAAANALLGQSPETVNAEQSEPSPSTHDSAKELNEERYAALHADLNDAAQADDKDTDKETHESAPETGIGQVVDLDSTEKQQEEQDKAKTEAVKENDAASKNPAADKKADTK